MLHPPRDSPQAEESTTQEHPSVLQSLEELRKERERTREERINHIKRRRTKLNRRLGPDLVKSIPALSQVIESLPFPPAPPQNSQNFPPSMGEKSGEPSSNSHQPASSGVEEQTNSRKEDRESKKKHRSHRERSDSESRNDRTTDKGRHRAHTPTVTSTTSIKNDYSQHFVDTGQRPQNFIRDSDLMDRFEEYPKLKELVQLKDKEIQDHATPFMYMKVDLKACDLMATLQTKFDVILIDPPWEEYRRRDPTLSLAAPNTMWTLEDLMQLKIDQISDSPSFLWLWVGSAEGLDQGRLLLKKWGFRRCEDICWLKTNRHGQQSTHMFKQDTRNIFQHTKEHCLMGIKGTVRRNTDGHFIHANIDTDIIISEEPPLGSTEKPVELYHIIEHFCLGRRRLELFGRDHNIRPGWVTLGIDISSSNYSPATYKSHFAGEAGHLLRSTPEIENLRPKSPTRQQRHATPNNPPHSSSSHSHAHAHSHSQYSHYSHHSHHSSHSHPHSYSHHSSTYRPSHHSSYPPSSHSASSHSSHHHRYSYPYIP